jgi:hypothetical protein
MRKIGWAMLLLLGCLVTSSLGEATMPYTYNFPKPPTEWGQATAFGNLSPGFFQVMYQNRSGVVRIATYGIVGAAMDNLKDPQLMMVFAFDQKGQAGAEPVTVGNVTP